MTRVQQRLLIQVAVLLLALAALVFSDPLDFADRRMAKIYADDFCRKAGCTLKVAVEVVGEDRMPRAALAFTTVMNRVGDGDRMCVLTFTSKSARAEEIVAHEACHCALDYPVLGAGGYVGLRKTETDRRERLVGACADRLMEKR